MTSANDSGNASLGSKEIISEQQYINFQPSVAPTDKHAPFVPIISNRQPCNFNYVLPTTACIVLFENPFNILFDLTRVHSPEFKFLLDNPLQVIVLTCTTSRMTLTFGVLVKSNTKKTPTNYEEPARVVIIQLHGQEIDSQNIQVIFFDMVLIMNKYVFVIFFVINAGNMRITKHYNMDIGPKHPGKYTHVNK